jgi:rod shape-determining protein MreC
MESFLNRYRNITVLILVILAQLALLSVQVKNDQQVLFIRVWTVTAVTPLAKFVDTLRGSTFGVVRNYIRLHEADADNRRLQKEVDRLQLDNIFLRNELNTADRAKALQMFEAHVPSKLLAAHVFFQGLGTGSMVFVDRGSLKGVMRGMGVITPDGIVGIVRAVYPTTSVVLLATDPEFAAGVISGKSQARGTMKGQGGPLCKVDYVAFNDKVEAGDWFYTSGDDRIFPRGFQAGVVKYVRPAQPYKEVALDPSGMWRGLDDVLIIMESVHQQIPETPPSQQSVYVAPAPPGVTSAAPANPASEETPAAAAQQLPGNATDADRLKAAYKSSGEAQGHTFGENLPHSKPPDFTKVPGAGTGPPGSAPSGAAAAPRVPGQGTKGTGSAVGPNAAATKGTGETAVPPPASKGTGPGSGNSTNSTPPPTKGTRSPDDVRRANQAAGRGGAL